MFRATILLVSLLTSSAFALPQPQDPTITLAPGIIVAPPSATVHLFATGGCPDGGEVPTPDGKTTEVDTAGQTVCVNFADFGNIASYYVTGANCATYWYANPVCGGNVFSEAQDSSCQAYGAQSALLVC